MRTVRGCKEVAGEVRALVAEGYIEKVEKRERKTQPSPGGDYYGSGRKVIVSLIPRVLSRAFGVVIIPKALHKL